MPLSLTQALRRGSDPDRPGYPPRKYLWAAAWRAAKDRKGQPDLPDDIMTIAASHPAQSDCRSTDGEPRRRIIHVLKHCGYGNGNVHVAVDLACVQARAGHDVTIVSSGGTFVDMLIQQGVRHVLMVQDVRKPIASLMSAVRLSWLCLSMSPDIIHAHMMGSALIGYVASRLTRIPLVTTVHNSFDRHAFIMRLGDQVVAVSEAERDQLLKRHYRPEQVDVVVNAPNESPREAFLQNSKIHVLSRPCVTVICGLHRRKGVFDVIAAFSSISADFPEWHLYIAGEGPDSQALQEQAIALGLGNRVTFLGFVASPKPLFEQTDIFVLASYADPGSLSIGEARRAGCAIIATAVGGTPEMLDFGAAGRLVPPGSSDSLAEEMRELMEDSSARSAVSATALAGAGAFCVTQLVARYDRIYRKAFAIRAAKVRRARRPG